MRMTHHVLWGYCHIRLLNLPNEQNWMTGQSVFGEVGGGSEELSDVFVVGEPKGSGEFRVDLRMGEKYLWLSIAEGEVGRWELFKANCGELPKH